MVGVDWLSAIPTHLPAIEKYLHFGHFSYKPKISKGELMVGIGFYNGNLVKTSKKVPFSSADLFFSSWN